jgi:methyl-accepting chemotaxis protein
MDEVQTQVVTALVEGSAQACAQALLDALEAAAPGRSPALLMVFASPAQPLPEVLPPLLAAHPSAAVLSASSAGEFTGQGEVQGGVSAFALYGDYVVDVGMGSGLGADVQGAVMAALAPLPEARDGYPHQVALVLLDTLSGVGEEAALIASAMLGEDVRLVGGAAGDQGMVRTVVGAHGRVESDAVVVAKLSSKAPLGLGVCNGHKPMSGPLTVTKAAGNVIEEIDGRPAWEVWVEQTRAHAQARGIDPATLDAPGDVFNFVVVYEAGLQLGEQEYKMRSPLSRDARGAMAFACGVPQGAVIRVMHSEPQQQVESAVEAARRARAQLGGGVVAGALVFDCICRKSILGARFQAAVDGMVEALGGAPLAGFETYGEVALDSGDMSGFHNTTTVVLAFPA